MDAPTLQPADLYINRELSQLEFNKRVLAQALDPKIPLLERLRFLCITCTNLDEFFEIRVAGLKQRIEIGAAAIGPEKLSAQQVVPVAPPIQIPKVWFDPHPLETYTLEVATSAGLEPGSYVVMQ